jgi:hypothetical protein
MSSSTVAKVSYDARRCCVTGRVDASGPKNPARMSFSIPTTSKPCSTKSATIAEPIKPPEPVTIAVGTVRLGEGGSRHL